MSGIIGGAGSKSGVIGETEIDYEEGDWTPTGSNLGSPVGIYTKIGNLVYVDGMIIPDGDTSSVFGGLPFTTASKGSGVVGYQNQDTTTTWSVLSDEFVKTFTFRAGSTSKSLNNAKELRFAMSYIV
jgi:hypothetical protein